MKKLADISSFESLMNAVYEVDEMVSDPKNRVNKWAIGLADSDLDIDRMISDVEDQVNKRAIRQAEPEFDID